MRSRLRQSRYASGLRCSTVAPVPTDSLSLPRGYLLTREKVGNWVWGAGGGWIADDGAVVFLLRGRRQGNERVVTVTDTRLDLDLPPSYSGLDDGRSTNEVPCGSRR
jgi:hypothetical protein